MPRSPFVRSGRSALVITAFTPLQLFGFRRIDLPDLRVRVRRAQHEPDELTRRERIRAVSRAAGDFVDAVRPRRPRADDFEFLIGELSYRLPSIRLRRFSQCMSVQRLSVASCMFFRGRAHRADDLVVARAAAQIAGQRVADLFFVRIGIAVEQRLGRHEKTRRADAALQRSVLDELALQRMQLAAGRKTFDRRHLTAFGFRAEHEARTHQAAIDGNAARAAIAGAAAFL